MASDSHVRTPQIPPPASFSPRPNFMTSPTAAAKPSLSSVTGKRTFILKTGPSSSKSLKPPQKSLQKGSGAGSSLRMLNSVAEGVKSRDGADRSKMKQPMTAAAAVAAKPSKYPMIYADGCPTKLKILFNDKETKVPEEPKEEEDRSKDEELSHKIPNLRPRRRLVKARNKKNGDSVSGAAQGTVAEAEDQAKLSLEENTIKDSPVVKKKTKEEKQKISTSLSPTEIDEDLYAMKGFKPSRMPTNRRPKSVQKIIDRITPGNWLHNVSPIPIRSINLLQES